MMDWLQTVTLAQIGLVFQLAILEGLLSFDNALALAALVSGRLHDPKDQRHALMWGMWGAYIFRIVVIFIGVWLMERPWIKLLAGLYLVYVAVKELFFKGEDEEGEQTSSTPGAVSHVTTRLLVTTIIQVELMDIMFSIDSIAVALAVSKEKWVLITGAILGILMMRVAASVFIKLIEKFPILVATAFVLVGIAGLKVCLEIEELTIGSFRYAPNVHIPESFFLPLMVIILLSAVGLNMAMPHRFAKKPSESKPSAEQP